MHLIMSPHTSTLSVNNNNNNNNGSSSTISTHSKTSTSSSSTTIEHDTIIELINDMDNLTEKEIRDVFYSLYSTQKQIGKGGFGIIFSGYRIKDNLPIAIKVIKKSKITQWFNLDGRQIPLEIALMLRVSHVKNCIKILDYMEQRNCFVIVMERIETCKDLFDYISEYGAMDEIKVKIYFKQIVQTICDIYKLGVVHRDIKDENILIDMKTGQLKIIDFGAGAFFTNKNCLFTDFQGTRVYSPPEWINKQSYYGDRATVWSLGVLLYNMVYGDIPWEEDNDIVKCHLYAKKHFTPNKPTEELDDLIRKCLEVNDDSRIDLLEILKHEWFSVTTD